MRYALALLLSSLTLNAYADSDVQSKHIIRAVYDTSVAGGQSVPHAVGVSVPAGAIITGAYLYINTQFAASGTESVGVSCLGSQNIMAYNSIKSIAPDRMFAAQLSNGITDTGAAVPLNAAAGGNALNLSQGFSSVPVACGLTVDVRGDSGYTPYTAGKLTLLLEYFKL